MLLKKYGRCLSILFATIVLFSLLPAQVVAEETTVWDNPLIAAFQKEIDRILSAYGITEEMTNEEIRVVIYGEDFDYLYALYEVTELEKAMIESGNSGKITEGEAVTFVDANPAFCIFAQALQDKYDADGSVSLLTTDTSISGLEIKDTANKLSVTGTTVTAETASGSLTSKKANTITITNTSGKSGILSFRYEASNYNSFTIGGTSVSGSGNYSSEFGVNSKVELYIQSKSGWNPGKATLSLSGITLSDPNASYDVTFSYDSDLGSITIGGEAISTGEVKSVSGAGVELIATPNNGSTFLGWINTSTNEPLSTSASYTLKPGSEMTVTAAFANAASKAWFSVGSSYFDDLNAAATYAASASTKVVVPVANGTLPAGSYSIPKDVTMLLPYNTAYTCNAEPKVLGSHTTPSAFRTLTMASGAHITVEEGGVINVASEVSAVGQNAGSWNGTPSGPHGRIHMNDGSSITLESGATLYAYGYVAGTGTVLAEPGSTVYECFQIRDWRGGSATCGGTSNALSGKLNSVFTDNDIFPVNQYYIQNIEAKLTIEGGATEKIFTAANASSVTPSTTGVFIGSGGLFAPAAGHSVTKYYSAADDRLIVELDGDASLSPMAISFYIILGTMDLNSANFVLPLPNNVTIKINSGTATVSQDIALVPGGEIIVAEGATLKLSSGKSAYIYDKDEWGNYAADSLQLVPVGYSAANGTTTKRNNDSLVDAKLDVNGTVIIDGNAYTTSNGANIISSGGTGIVTVNAIGTESNTYQATQSGTTMTKVNVPITSAKLKNADGTYVTSEKATYTYANGKWCKNHDITSTVTKEPTCGEAGVKTFSCAGSCGTSYTEPIPATGKHTEVIDAAVPPTCTATGLTEGKHCSVCEEVFVKQEEVPTLGHRYGDGEITSQPTFDADGVMTYTCSVCGDTKTEAIPKKTAVAQIGSTKYESLTDAVGAAINGSKIYLLANSDEMVTIGKCLVIFKNGFDARNITAGEGLYLSTTDSYIAVVKGFTVASAECAYDAEVVLRIKLYIPDDFKNGGYSITLHKDGRWENHVGNDKSFAVNTMAPAERDSLYWTYIGVASGEMGRIVTVTALDADNQACTLYYTNGDAVGTEFAYSVQDYIKSGLEQFGNDENRLAAVKALAVYGGYAQQYFNVDADSPVYSVLDSADAALTGIESVSAESLDAELKTDGEITGINVKSLEPFLDSATYLRVKFLLDAGAKIEDYAFSVTYPDGSDLELTPEYEAETQRYFVDILNIPAAYLDHMYKVTVTNKNTNETYTVNISVMVWVKLVIGKSTNINQVNMAKALYLYNQAANALFGK